MFEKIGNNSLKNYGLCPSQYLSAPSLRWDAMLKITKIELEIIPDPDMYIFFEKDTYTCSKMYQSSKVCVLKVDLEYPKELRELLSFSSR